MPRKKEKKTMPRKRHRSSEPKTTASSSLSKRRKQTSSEVKTQTRRSQRKVKEAVVVEDVEEELSRMNAEEENDVDMTDMVGASLTNNATDGPAFTKGKEKANEERVGKSKKSKVQIEIGNEEEEDDDGPSEARFIGVPVPVNEARRLYPHRYERYLKLKEKASSSKIEKSSNGVEDTDEKIQARRHYKQAEVDGTEIYNLHDDAYVHAGEGNESYICRIVEMFEGEDGKPYFTARWFYRKTDTVIKEAHDQLDEKRVYLSEIRNDNPLGCLVKKLNIVQVDLDQLEVPEIECDYYYNLHYLLPYSTFVKIPSENKAIGSGSSSTISSEIDAGEVKSIHNETGRSSSTRELHLLDLYCGCGAMSTGLCLGAKIAGVNLVTKWAVDINEYACESLEHNHPNTKVRNESTEDFLLLLKEWEKLCIRFSLIHSDDPEKAKQYPFDENAGDDDDEDSDEDSEDDPEVFEVEKILSICYGDPKQSGKTGLYFKVSWKNYSSEYDTWEPIEGLVNCFEVIRNFVTEGYKSKILPLPGDADVICGGPPCQGISGFNRFRDIEDPLRDEKNKQLLVFMGIVRFLRPKYVLMENVVDLLKFKKGFLGRYAVGCLIDMGYQSRMGLMAAGAYGLPQFRMRVFLWGACSSKMLPQFPLPTHDVIGRGVAPTEFEDNVVAHVNASNVQLEQKLLLGDAISDLPAVENNESSDEMPYGGDPKTYFQQQIRSKGDGIVNDLLFDHRPLQLNEDDFQRVCQIPRLKGANFRNLKGVRVRPDNKVELDPDIPRVYLPSGKPLVPDYALTFVNGTSTKPFARLWWDEIIPTVVTRAEPHNQVILHPEQDRVLTIRENARLQGFPDHYRLFGPVKERYIQVGNAVAVPVARALGYALGMAVQDLAGDEPVFTLPSGFPNLNVEHISSESSNDNA